MVCSHKIGATLDSLKITIAFKLISLSLIHLASAENIKSYGKTSDPVCFPLKVNVVSAGY